MEGKQENQREMVCSSSNNRAALVQNGCIVEYEFATVLRSIRVVKGDKEVIDMNNEHVFEIPNIRHEENRMAIQIPGNDDEACDVVEIDKEHFYKKKRAREGGDVLKRAVVQVGNEQLNRLLGSSRLSRNQSEYAGEVRNKVVDLVRKSKEKIDDENHDLRIMRRVSQVLGNELVVHSEPGDRQGIHGQARTQKCARCSIEFEVNDLEVGEGGSEMLQILDIAHDGPSPFVSSKKFHKSMVNEESPTAFREEVLRILGQPFDKEEYRKHKEAIKVGSYLHHHPDLKRKLKTYRHKRGKRLVILRGFFYWLQNLTKEGSFQPWTDKQCLAVDPPSS